MMLTALVMALCIIGVGWFCFWGRTDDWRNAVNRARQHGVGPPQGWDVDGRAEFRRKWGR